MFEASGECQAGRGVKVYGFWRGFGRLGFEPPLPGSFTITLEAPGEGLEGWG